MAAPIVGAIAMAASLVLFLRSPSRERNAGEASERSKGGGHVTFHVRHGDTVRTGVEGDRLSPGDGIEFTYTTSSAGYLAIFSVDGARHASIYLADGDRALRITPGIEVPPTRSVVLDDTLGEETIYALFCADAVLTEPIRAELERDRRSAVDIRGCSVDRHVFVKVAKD